MARGVIPRQPAKTGRHEAARKVELRTAKLPQDVARSKRNASLVAKPKAKVAKVVGPNLGDLIRQDQSAQRDRLAHERAAKQVIDADG